MHKITGTEYTLNRDSMPHNPVSKEYDFELEHRANGDVIFLLHGGPTGYESFYIDEKVIKRMGVHGWNACFGTPGIYNRLEFTSEQMRAAFKQANLL